MASSTVIELIRARLANLKACSDALSGVDHDVLRGRFREILLDELLRPYLPAHVELLTGTIVGANGEERIVRNEDDIIVFDRTWAPLLLGTRGRDAIVPITGVRAHIEIKSRLDSNDIKSAVAAAVELNRMSVKTAPMGLLFAFGTNIGMDRYIPDLLIEHVNQLKYHPTSGQTTCPVQGVCILGRGSWFLLEVNKVPGWYEVKAEKDREILAFMSVVSNSIFGNDRGLGTHVLDLSWMQGPKPMCPLCAS